MSFHPTAQLLDLAKTVTLTSLSLESFSTAQAKYSIMRSAESIEKFRAASDNMVACAGFVLELQDQYTGL